MVQKGPFRGFFPYCLIIILLSTAFPIFSLAESLKDPVSVGSERQLFIDKRFIAESQGVNLVMNSPVKKGQVVRADQPWEDFRLTSYFTVVQDGDLYRMYYSCFSKDQWHTPDAWEKYAFLCYAESKDGTNWEKPKLGIVDFEGSKENNILLQSVVDGTVFLDPKAPSERRYKLLHTIGPHKGGLRVSYSSDGIHFTIADQPVIAWNPDSQQNAFWDATLGKYLVFLRGIEEMGIKRPESGAWRRVVRLALDDIEKSWPQGTPEVVFAPDLQDPPEVDFYTNAIVKYPWAQDAYFIFPAAYHHFPPEMGNDGLLDVSMGVSRDSIHWERPDRRPYIPLGMQGEWDSQFLMLGVGLVRKGNDLYQFYNGVDLSHGGTRRMSDEQREKWRRWSQIGLVQQRLDGFISADFDYQGGHLLTPPLVFNGNHLELNLNTSSAGSAYVALEGPLGEPIEGFTMADSDKIMANDVAHTVTWKGKSDLSALSGRTVRVSIQARSTKLYAFQFKKD